MRGNVICRWVLAGVALVGVACAGPARSANGFDRQELVDELVTANHILANEGVLDGYGHVSVRSPANANHYFLARAGAPALVRFSDVIDYDLDSKPVAATQAAGYIGRFIHGESYKTRPDVTSIGHCHCPEVIPFGATSVPMQPMHHMGYFVGEGVPVFDIRKAGGVTDMLISTPELGRALAQSLGTVSAVLLRGHGAAVVATSLRLVTGKAYYLNLSARLQWQAMQLGGGPVSYLDREASKKAANNYERSWDFWKSRL